MGSQFILPSGRYARGLGAHVGYAPRERDATRLTLRSMSILLGFGRC